VSPGAYLPVGAVRARAPGDDGDGGGGAEEHVPVIQCMKWGLVPSFTGKNEKLDHFRMVWTAPSVFVTFSFPTFFSFYRSIAIWEVLVHNRLQIRLYYDGVFVLSLLP
jgi:hypothetical protein